jgi:hypothetical protein
MLNLRFRSGMSSASDLRGGIDAGVPIGVVASKLSTQAKILALPRYLDLGGAVFIDSGAFSEMGTGVEPDWNTILGTYESVSDLCNDRSRLFVVAPDKVGDQASTLERLNAHLARVLNLIHAGCRVIVPLQTGALPVAEMLDRVIDMLGTSDFVVGIPSNKEALSISDCESLCHHAYHILGRVQMDDDQAMRISGLRKECPDAVITADANWLRSRLKQVQSRTEQVKNWRIMSGSRNCYDHPRAEAISRVILADSW